MKTKCGLLSVALLLIFVLSLPFSAVGQQQAELQEIPKFSISRIVIAEDIQDREPLGVAEIFPASTEKVYCFIEATNILETTEATFVWYHEGKEMRSFSLPLIEKVQGGEHLHIRTSMGK